MAKLIDMSGKEFNGCIVLRREGTSKDRKATWLCRCYCGKEFITTGKSIRNGDTMSCGCFRASVLSSAGEKNKTHGETNTRLYNIWRGMKKRCLVPNDTSYKYYGGKGINVCKEWADSYEAFREWALSNGYKDNLTLDRLDSKDNYRPDNCRWVDWITQGRNRSSNVFVNFNGESMTLSQVAEQLGESKEFIWYRYKNDIDFSEEKRRTIYEQR